MRYYFTPVRKASIQKQEVTSVGEIVEKRISLYPAERGADWCSHCGK
jgi:hypothetical protein